MKSVMVNMPAMGKEISVGHAVGAAGDIAANCHRLPWFPLPSLTHKPLQLAVP